MGRKDSQKCGCLGQRRFSFFYTQFTVLREKEKEVSVIPLLSST